MFISEDEKIKVQEVTFLQNKRLNVFAFMLLGGRAKVFFSFLFFLFMHVYTGDCQGQTVSDPLELGLQQF